MFGGRLGFVPYMMPGFDLAKKPTKYSSRSRGEGLILSKHGIVTFGDRAREAYERMIEMVSRADELSRATGKLSRSPCWRVLAATLPRLRRSCGALAAKG